MSPNDKQQNAQQIENDIGRMLDILAAQFPICTSNDEFHFFPQIPPGPSFWTRWDDFRPESIASVCNQLLEWLKRIEEWWQLALPGARKIDLFLMRRVFQTLYEQLADVDFHRCQPTFYLTIMGIGLAEGVEAGPRCFTQRLEGAPAFLEQATSNLAQVPGIYSRLGREMAARLQHWLRSLPDNDQHVSPVVAALEAFGLHLKRCQANVAFLPPVERYARIVSAHYGCRTELAAIDDALDCEIADTVKLLRQHADRVDRGKTWQEVVAGLKTPDARIRPQRHYRKAIDRLEQHCIDRGLLPAGQTKNCPVTVLPIPQYMRPVRSNAAFSAAPGHPARGGIFFIADDVKGAAVPADYSLLAAHETYPGHHLLDTSRWNHNRPLRRPIEFPLFYEGWASFSEELLFDTGFFRGPIDDLLMAKRRFWRALRGRVDFNIHCRRQNLEQAADLLAAHGMAPQRAKAMVERYILKPGYQLSYTIGRRRFRRLYDQFRGSRKAVDFTRLVLSQGEIEFDQLETIMAQGG
jgi:hypothetical protein